MARRIAHLVGLDHRRPKDPKISLGIASIVSLLRARAIEHTHRSYNVASAAFSAEAVVSDILRDANQPTSDVWIGAFVWNEPYVHEVCRLLRNNGFQGRIGVAGPQVSYVSRPNALEQYYPNADMFIRGYAEEAVCNVTERSDQPVSGFHLSGQRDMVRHASAALECIPSPHLTGVLADQAFVRWETRRGCPYQCSFCQHREPNANMTSRLFDYNRVLNEIRFFCSLESATSDIAVLDPTFNTNTLHACTVLENFGQNNYRGKLSLQIRPEKLNARFLDVVGELACSGTNVVLELGVQTLQAGPLSQIDRVKGGDLSRVIEKVKSSIIEVNRRGISHRISLIFGLPEQTLATFISDVEWCESNSNADIDAYPLMLLRGTPLYERKGELGLIEATEIAHPLLDRVQTFIPHVVTTPHMSREDWAAMATIAAELHDKIETKEKQASLE